MITKEQLTEAAITAREMAYAPYSGFRVGAALLTTSGEIITGCNIESASYGLTLCAERVAIFKAVSEGISEFSAIAVAADTDQLTSPCGACRQVMWEFGKEMSVTLVNLNGVVMTAKMSELLPNAFDRSFLKTI